MPLMKFHVLKGQSAEEVDMLLDAAHDAMVRSFEVPERDRKVGERGSDAPSARSRG